MGRLAIRHVKYAGKQYAFTSPDFPAALVIVETALADLIYCALHSAAPTGDRRG